jgi:hypothetical protein
MTQYITVTLGRAPHTKLLTATPNAIECGHTADHEAFAIRVVRPVSDEFDDAYMALSWEGWPLMPVGPGDTFDIPFFLTTRRTTQVQVVFYNANGEIAHSAPVTVRFRRSHMTNPLPEDIDPSLWAQLVNLAITNGHLDAEGALILSNLAGQERVKIALNADDAIGGKVYQDTGAQGSRQVLIPGVTQYAQVENVPLLIKSTLPGIPTDELMFFRINELPVQIVRFAYAGSGSAAWYPPAVWWTDRDMLYTALYHAGSVMVYPALQARELHWVEVE